MDVCTNEEDSVNAYLISRIKELEDKLAGYPLHVEEVTPEEENEPVNNELLEKAVEAAQQAPTVPARQVPIGPVPMSWNISQGQGSEGLVVIIQVQTAEGDKIFFVAPSVAQQLGEALLKLSSATESGLILP